MKMRHRKRTARKSKQNFSFSRDKLLLIKTERGALIFSAVLLNKTVKIGQTDDGPSSAEIFKAKFYSPFATTGNLDFLFINKS